MCVCVNMRFLDFLRFYIVTIKKTQNFFYRVQNLLNGLCSPRQGELTDLYPIKSMDNPGRAELQYTEIYLSLSKLVQKVKFHNRT